jgi:hypothetical protein
MAAPGRKLNLSERDVVVQVVRPAATAAPTAARRGLVVFVRRRALTAAATATPAVTFAATAA